MFKMAIFSALIIYQANIYSEECTPEYYENVARMRELVARVCNIPYPAECSIAPQYIGLASYEVVWTIVGNRARPTCLAKDCFGNYSPWFNRNFSIDYIATCEQEDITVELPETEAVQTSTNNTSPLSSCGSVIYNSNQVVGEAIPLSGLPFYLSHFSSNVQGRIGDYRTKFAVASSLISPLITGTTIITKDELGNLLDSKNYSNSPNQTHMYTWNGLDAEGKSTWGSKNHKIIYKVATSNNSVADKELSLNLGNFKAIKLGLGGWIPSNWYFYDNDAEKIYKGNGSIRNVKAVIEGNLRRVASENGSEIYYFDELGRIVFTKTGITGAVLYSFQYRSDEKLESITDTFNKMTRFNYDSNGNISEIVSSENIIVKLKLNGDGYLVSVQNLKNEIYNMTYKDNGGLLATFKKPNGNVTSFSYDEEGNLLIDANSAGFSSTLSKTDVGVSTSSAMGRMTQNNFDKETNSEVHVKPSGLVTKYVSSLNESSVLAPNFSSKTVYQFDPRFGNQVKVPLKIESNNFGSDVISFNQEVILNDSNNPFSIATMTSSISNGESEIVSTYDSLTRTKTITTAMGRTISTQIDSLERPVLEKIGNLVPQKYYYSQELLTRTKQGEREYRYNYHPQSKLLTSIINPSNEVTGFEYDEAQRLKAKTFPDGRKTKYTYDSEGNLISLTPPGRPEHKQIIGSNELISSYNPPSLEGVNSVNTTYTYNLDKQLIKITRPNGNVINYNFDSITGLLNSTTGSFGSILTTYQNELPIKIKDNNGRSVEFGYLGKTINTETSRTSSGTIFSIYKRAPLEGAEGITSSESIEAGSDKKTIESEYDADKVLSKKGDLNLFYNLPNRALKESSIGNLKEHYKYNNFGEIKGFRVTIKKNNREELLYSYSLVRDRSGRIIGKEERFEKDCFDHSKNKQKSRLSQKNQCHKRNREDITNRYYYDSSGRLVRAKNNYGPGSYYLYDLNSNRIAGNSGKEPFVAIYDNQDRLIRFNNNIYTYNANGELLTKAVRLKNSYQTTDYVYDDFGQLKKAGNINYETSLLNNRLSKKVNGVIKSYYVYSSLGQLIGELDTNMNLIKTFIYATKSHVPDYFIDQDGNSFKIITDHLGSVRLVVDVVTGEVVQKMLHDEFGKVLVDTNASATPFGFAGGLYDFETGLVRFGARDYDPEIGRWTSKDPIRFEAGDSNLYGYVLQDPVNFNDPDGMFPKDLDEAGECLFGNTTVQIENFQRNITRNNENIKKMQDKLLNSCSANDIAIQKNINVLKNTNKGLQELLNMMQNKCSYFPKG